MSELLVVHVKLDISKTSISLGDRSDVAVPTIGQPRLHTSIQGIIVYGDGWKEMVYGLKAGTRDALLRRNVDTQTKSGPPSGGWKS